MERKYILGIFALGMLALLGFGTISAFGWKNQISDEERESLRNSIESGDYDSWKKTKEAQISEERFAQIRSNHEERAEFRQEMEKARSSGDLQKMQELKEKYGLGKGMNNKNKNFAQCPFSE